MKIVIAPDSFKDSLSADGVAQAIAQGLAEVLPNAELVQCPMADGGEGTVEAILAALHGECRHARVCGPLGVEVSARWGWLAKTRTAVIEMAEASGLQLVALEQRDACLSSSYGTGQLILDALDAGAETIILTIGGSATNDGGAGMLNALGVCFRDAGARELTPGGLALSGLCSIDLSGMDPRLHSTRFEVAADVDNPFVRCPRRFIYLWPAKGCKQRADRAVGSSIDSFRRLLRSCACAGCSRRSGRRCSRRHGVRRESVFGRRFSTGHRSGGRIGRACR